jgi:predicted ArsR family transcriptional regulator
MGDGVPLLTTNQSRVLNRLLQLGQTGAHAYGLSQDLGIKEETVRSALASLKTKGLVENGALSPSSMGPARHVFHVVDPQRASNAITAEKDRRDRKIEELSQRLAALTRS